MQTLWRANVPQLYVDVDREKAKALGVPIDELFNTLAATLGSYYVNDFNKFGRTWQVLMSAEPAYRNRPDDIGADLRALGQRARWCRCRRSPRCDYSSGPDTLDRFNNLPAVKIFGQARAGRQLGPGDRARSSGSRREVLPRDFSYDWGGASLPGEALGGLLELSRSGSARCHGVPDPRGAVREVVAAAVGAARAAVRHVRRARRGLAARA